MEGSLAAVAGPVSGALAAAAATAAAESRTLPAVGASCLLDDIGRVIHGGGDGVAEHERRHGEACPENAKQKRILRRRGPPAVTKKNPRKL